MRKPRRLDDAYRFPGFRPEATVRGIFGDPKARILRLLRRGKKLRWQTWGETPFFELTEIPGGVTSEASLLAAAFPALVQVGTQAPPILHIPCRQFQPFLRTQSRGQACHHAR